MKTFLLLLTFLAFLQSAFLPINMVLSLLIARSLVFEDKDNLILAFFGGLVLSFLTQVNLAYFPIVFILVAKLAAMLKILPISLNFLMVFLYGSLLITLVAFLNSFFIGQQLTVLPHLIESVLVLPVFYLIKLWGERFRVKSHIKLKM